MLPLAKMRSWTLRAFQQSHALAASDPTSFTLRESFRYHLFGGADKAHSCWDGKNLDSPNHQDHVAYPQAGPQQFTGSSVGGDCPSTHPVKIPQIMLEIVWDTTAFNDKAEWPADGTIPSPLY